MDELNKLGWNICLCEYQADTHIGQIYRDDPDKTSLAVVTNDSDLIVYDGVPSVTMPIGKSRELRTFSKSDVLQALGMPSSRHFQLTAILTRNDYFSGLPWYGIKRNADL
ncbi:hypothetical protein BGZ65_013036, partial [Modicella reniformis]